jgi:hypothetical protein
MSSLSTFCPVSFRRGELVSVLGKNEKGKANARPNMSHAVEYKVFFILRILWKGITELYKKPPQNEEVVFSAHFFLFIIG